MLAIFVVAATAIGMVRWYSPVPYYDMWNGGVVFYEGAQSGDFKAWWEPHNEHRIVMTRALLWMDFAWLQGADVAPRIANILLLVFAAWVLWRMAMTLRPATRRNAADCAFGLFIVAWLGSWMQKENLTSGFQSCFVLAFVVPLVAFDQLGRSIEFRSTARFMRAAALGVISVGTMVNGLVVLPLMTLQAIVSGATRLRCVVLGALSLSTAAVYLVGGGFGALASVDPLHGDLLIFAQSLLYYLGAPFHFLLKQGITGRVGAIVAGATLLIIWVTTIARERRFATPHRTRVALLVFVGYVIVSAAMTAWGRMRFGADQGLVSRYTTPPLLGWAAIFVIVRSQANRSRRTSRFATLGTIVVSLLMIRQQGEALRSSPASTLFERNVAGLALALQIDDGPTIRTVFPNTPVVLGIAAEASDRHLSVFRRFPFRDLRDAIGQTTPSEALPTYGVVDRIDRIDDRRYLRLEGRLHGSLGVPGRLRLIDAAGRTVGFALPSPGPLTAGAVGSSTAGDHAVRGYVLASFTAPLRMVGEGPSCGPGADR